LFPPRNTINTVTDRADLAVTTLAHQVEELTLLIQADARLMRATSLAAAMDELLHSATGLIAADGAVLELWEDGARQHRHVARCGLTAAAVAGLTEAFAAGRSTPWSPRTLVLDLDDVQAEPSPLRDAAARAGLRTLRVMELPCARGRSLGWLGTFHRRPRRSEPRRLQLLRIHLEHSSGLLDQMLQSARALREARASLQAMPLGEQPTAA
jgi:hypothetical protein